MIVSDDRSRGFDRRSVLRTITALGGAGVFGVGRGRGATTKEFPNTYEETGTIGDSFTDPVAFRHITDLPETVARVEEYEETGDERRLMTTHLLERIEETSADTIDVTVSTTGERRQIESARWGRELNGWTPRSSEVDELAEFGEPLYVPDIACTKIGLADVPIDWLSDLADLSYVFEIGFDPIIDFWEFPTLNQEPTAETVRTDHTEFDEVGTTLPEGLRVGCFHNGYDDTITDYSQPWAATQGIDTTLSKDFTGNGSWQSPGNAHGTNVIDTTAFDLQGKVTSDHYVSLRVLDLSKSLRASEWNRAIEYALRTDIPVTVSSLALSRTGYCPSTLCEALESYNACGYAMTAASGNFGYESRVAHPATSYHAISVGGYGDQCTGGFNRSTYSNYGEIDYWDSNRSVPYCKWCHDGTRDVQFQPDVYACYEFLTDAGNKLAGTSFASPTVGAGAAVRSAANGYEPYATQLSRYHGMSNKAICPGQAAGLGDVLHVPDLV